MKKIGILLFCMAFLMACSASGTDSLYSNPETPQIANDLSNQRVSSFAEDEHGHIWIGTFRGLHRFNVHEYHQHFCTDEENSLPDNQIQYLFKDSKNRLWVSSVNGMALYTDRDDFKRIPMESMSRNSVQILEDKEGRIYINTSISLCRYDEQEERFVEIQRLVGYDLPPVSSCYIAPDDDILLVGPMHILRYDSNMKLKETVNLQSYSNYTSMTPDGRLWMSSYSGLAVYDTGLSSYVELPAVFKTHKIFTRAMVTNVHQHGHSMGHLQTSVA